MGCGCTGTSNVEYKVTFRDGTTAVFANTTLASAAIRERGGGTMKPVPKSA